MDEALLKKYGIDPTLPTSQLLEQLQNKNLELLERMGSCSDETRLSQLQAEQKEVEDVISSLSCAVSLDRQVVRKQTGQAAADPLQLALQSYQSHDYDAAFPVLAEHARQGDPLCCILTANILLARNQLKEAKEYLYAAANAGNGTAALQLAQLYQKENLLPSAVKWAQKAVEQKEPGSWKLLSVLLATSGQPEKAIQTRLQELESATGYRRRDVLIDTASLLRSPGVSPGTVRQVTQQVGERLREDSVNYEYWTGQTGSLLKKAAAPPDGIPAFSLFLSVASPILSFCLLAFDYDSMGDVIWPCWLPVVASIIITTVYRLVSRQAAHPARQVVFALIKIPVAIVVISLCFSIAYRSGGFRAILLIASLVLEGLICLGMLDAKRGWELLRFFI